MNVPRSTDGGGVSPAPGITAGVGRGRGSRPRSLVRGQLIVLGLPLAAQRGQEVVRLYRGRVVAEGVCGGERAGEVHEDGPRAEDHVAVALAVHARLVPRAQHAALAVAQRGVRGLVLGLLLGAARRAQQLVLVEAAPPRQAAALLGLELGLGGHAGGLQHGLHAEVAVAAVVCAHAGLLLLDLGQPGEQLVRVALGHLGVGQEGVPGGAGLLGGDGGGGRGGEDGHGTRQRRIERGEESPQREIRSERFSPT